MSLRRFILLAGTDPFLPETRALLQRMDTLPPIPRQGLIDRTIRGLISAGLWATFDSVNFPAAHDAQAARLDWKNAAHDLVIASGTPAFTEDVGYSGGTGGLIQIGLNLSTAENYALGDAAASIWAVNVGDGPFTLQALGTNVTVVSLAGTGSTAGAAVVGINQTGGSTTTRPGVPGMLTASRKDGSSNVFFNGESTGALPTEGLSLPANVGLLNGGGDTLRFSAIGSGRTEEQEAALYDIVSTYLAGL